MAKTSRTGEKDKGLSHEVAGIAIIALALYAGVSVFSPLSGEQWGGIAGTFFFSLAFRAIGYASYILPPLLLVIGFKLLLRRALTISVFAPISMGIFLVAASALMAMVDPASGAGGAAGEAIERTLAHYAGRAGSLGVLVALIVISVLAFSGISKKKRRPAATGASPVADYAEEPEYEDYDSDSDDYDEEDDEEHDGYDR